jgi:branched-chain amino acid transport system substrate-binding protein
MLRSTACAALLLLAATILASGCGDDDGTAEAQIIGDSVTVYSSVPLRGPLAPVARDMVRAQKLALREAGGRAGVYDVSFAVLDSSDPQTGRWNPARIAANARRAVQDRQTVAYLGEIETGASAVSVPILNEGGILQVSPRDTFGGLTAPGARGEPDKYYPSGLRTFTRVVPGDDVQARVLVRTLAARGVRRLVLADDRQLAGASLADRIAALAPEAGIDVVERLRLDPGGEVPDGVGRDVRRQRADAFLYAGAGGDFAGALLRRVHAAAPQVLLLGTDDLALAPGLAGAAGDARDRLVLTGIEPRPVEGADDFARRFAAAYGRAPDRQAVLGYDAMRLVLRAIARAGAGASSRQAVIRQALGGSGDPRARFVRYRVEGNRLVRVGSQL